VGAPDATADIIQRLFDRESRAAERGLASLRLFLLGVGLFVLMPLRVWIYGVEGESGPVWFDLAVLSCGFVAAVLLRLWLRRPDWPRGLSSGAIVLDYALLYALAAGMAWLDYVPELELTVETYKLFIPIGLVLNVLSGARLWRRHVILSGICCALLVVEARALDMWLYGAPFYALTNILLLSLVLATSVGALLMVYKVRGLIGEASSQQAEVLRVKDVLSRYVSRPVAEAVLQDVGPLSAGRRQRVTVMFTDIRGFTALSERMSPERVVAFLNTYFSRMVGIVFAFEGMLDKYMGDGMMAVFGAPIAREDHALRAVQAAFRMREELVALNAELTARGRPPVSIGIGIHTGECVIGNIGTEQRMDYTAIGDVVNTASRIEALSKELGVDILVSADTFAEVRDRVVARSVPAVKVRGRSAPLDLYALEALRTEEEAREPGAVNG
jgi:class 3 adenylate cyclase